MSNLDSQRRSGGARRALLLLPACVGLALPAHADPKQQFLYGGEPIHPGCVHALAMHQTDQVPVTTAVSLEGCASSERSRATVHYESDDLAVIEDDELLGGDSFAYRVFTRLDNGMFGLAIRRIYPDGQERVSLAGVTLVERPMVRHGTIVQLTQMELIGEIWIPGMDLMSFRSVGNRVHFVAGVGREKVERDVDFTRLGKMRK